MLELNANPHTNAISPANANPCVDSNLKILRSQHPSFPPNTIPHADDNVRLAEVWWDIREKVLTRLIDSMLHSVQALLAAGGWYTEY